MQSLEKKVETIKIPSQFEIHYKKDAFANIEEAEKYAHNIGLEYCYHMVGFQKTEEGYISIHHCDSGREELTCKFLENQNINNIDEILPSTRTKEQLKKLHDALENAWKASYQFTGSTNSRYQKELRDLLDLHQNTL